MNRKVKEIILYTTLLILGIYFLFTGLVKAKGFLVPFSLAVLFSMILLPVDNWLRSLGLPKALSIVLSDLLLMAFCLGIIFLTGWQIRSITENWPGYKKRLQPKIGMVQDFVEKNTGIGREKQADIMQKIINSNAGGQEEDRHGIYHKIISFPGNFLLVFVYIFFFMFYRKKFKNAIVNFFPEERRVKASRILSELGKVGRQYLAGRFMLLIILAVLYFAGLSITGIRNALMISLLGALLSLIPYIGNVLAVIIAAFMSLLAQNSMGAIIGVLLVFTIAQFVESYILEPYLVGHKVEVNPAVVFTGVIIGGITWGIAGMILSIPFMGFCKTIFDRIRILQPIGYVFDEQDTGAGDGLISRIIDRITGKNEE